MLRDAGVWEVRGVTAHRLIERWEAPQGFRLASVIATTYELQADFLEEDLLPVALGLRLAPARGRDFRLELERALGDTEVTIFFHPGRYQPGFRRSPRIDLVPLPEGRYPKLHAKVVLMRFVTPAAPEALPSGRPPRRGFCEPHGVRLSQQHRGGRVRRRHPRWFAGGHHGRAGRRGLA